jgi:hypothetical protein
MFEKLLRCLSMVGVSSHITQLQEYIDDTEDYINIQVLFPLLHLQDMKLNYLN